MACAQHNIGAHDYASDAADAARELLALVITAVLLPLLVEWQGDDNVDAIEEVMLGIFGCYDAPKLYAYVGAIAIFEAIDDIGRMCVWLIVHECGATLHGNACPKHACHRIVVGCDNISGAWQQCDATAA